MTFASDAGGIRVDGLATDIHVKGDERADAVRAETLAGEDTVTGGVATAGAAHVVADGGDGFDHAIYRGTAGADTVQLVPENGNVVAAATRAALFTATPASEDVDVQGLDGADTIAALNGLPGLTLDGGPGDDDVRGGSGPDVVLGGSGNDHVDGNIGADVAQLGSGADVFQWDPATAATRSTARAAATGSTSTGPTPARTSTSAPAATACA